MRQFGVLDDQLNGENKPFAFISYYESCGVPMLDAWCLCKGSAVFSIRNFGSGDIVGLEEWPREFSHLALFPMDQVRYWVNLNKHCLASLGCRIKGILFISCDALEA